MMKPKVKLTDEEMKLKVYEKNKITPVVEENTDETEQGE